MCCVTKIRGQRKFTWKQGKHANTTQKCYRRPEEQNPDPSFCEAPVLTTKPVFLFITFGDFFY